MEKESIPPSKTETGGSSSLKKYRYIKVDNNAEGETFANESMQQNQ